MKRITVVGLGSGDYKQLTLEAFNIMKNAKSLVLRTEKHPTVEYIKEQGISFITCDDVYDSENTFEDTYNKICTRILDMSRENEDVVYAVPGHPLVAEKSVELIKQRAEGEIEVVITPAVSFIDAILTSLNIDPVNGLSIIDGLSLDKQKPVINSGNIITQVYNRFVTSEIKLKLMEYYKDEFELYVIRAAGVEGLERIEKIKLYELDRIEWVDYLTSIYIPPDIEGAKYKSIDDFVDLIKILRSENGCSWDREQTHQSLKPSLLEEAYEVLDAIEKNDMDSLKDELGDLLLQVVLHSEIADENSEFCIGDVVTNIIDKLVKRHPHIFGDVESTKDFGTFKSWEKSKMEQKGFETYTQILKDIPQILPALIRSIKVQQKASLVGFDWDNIDDVIAKVDEELLELREVYKDGNKQIIEEEIGDLLFSVVNVSRFLKIHPELALKSTIEKFINRFTYMEDKTLKLDKKIDRMTLEELDLLWEEAKTHNLVKKD